MNRGWFSVSWAFVFGIPVLLACPARAADVSTSECLRASDTSIKYDNEHRLRAERAELLLCAAASCPVDIRKECVRRVEEINAAIPTIVFAVRDASGNDLTQVKVTMDEEVVADRLEGIPVSVDPGPHMFSFEVIGHAATLRRTLVIRQGQKNRTEVISLETTRKPPLESWSRPTGLPMPGPVESPSVSPAASVTASSPPFGGPSREQSREQSEDGLGPQRTLAIASLVVGVAGVGAGAVFGMQAVSKRDKAQTACPGSCRDPAGVEMWQDAKRSGNLATGAFVVGGVGLVGAAILWITGGPTSIAAGPTVGPQELKVAVTGRW